MALQGPASSATGGIYMQTQERSVISMALHLPKVWEQFVDDVYSILKHIHLKTFSITSIIFIKISSLL